MTRKVLLPFLLFFNFLWLSTVLFGQVTVWEWNPPSGAGTGNSNWSDLNANWTRTLGSGPSLPGSRLEWRGLGDPTGINNLSGLFLQRLSFFGPLSYNISGNQVTLLDASPGGNGMVWNESPVEQNILFPILFDDYGKDGIITTQSTGRLGLTGISLGNNLLAFRIYGENTEGVITLTDALNGIMPVIIGQFGGSPKPNTRVVFTGNNSLFTGSLTINSGILNVQNNTALGTSVSSPATVSTGSALELSGGISLSGRNISIAGTGLGNTGALRNVLGSNSILSGILINGNSRIGNDAATTSLTLNKIGREISSTLSGLTFSGVGNIILNDTVGNVADPLNGNFTKTGTGILTIRQPCFYNGGTNVNSNGVLVLGANNVLPVTGITLNLATLRSSATTGSAGYSQTFKRLTLSNSSTIALGTGNHILTFDTSTTATWAANAKLTITGWQGNPGESGTAGFGKIFFNGDSTGLTETQLSQITFSGYCDGAKLLATGELVPAIRPFIQTVTTSNGPAGLAGFSGFFGATITIDGCLFSGATKVEIGSTVLLPPQFTVVNSDRITFILGDAVNGLIKITTPLGERTSPTPLTNLGYITKATNNTWSNGPVTWLGDIVPPIDRPVSINHNNVTVDINVNSLNPINPPTNPLTIYAGYLRLSATNRFPINTPLVLAGGSFRLYNSNVSTPANNLAGSGFSQEFSTLTLNGSSSIAFGYSNISRPVHEVRFAASNLVPWTAGAVLTIANWDSVGDDISRRTRIFVGTDATGLTPEQLRQIKFGSKCQGAKILSSGELVPAEAPFISNVVADPSPGPAYQAYYGSKVIISGCKFDLVNNVEINGTSIAPFTLVGSPATSIEFTYTEGLPVDRITVHTNEIPERSGFSEREITPAGYATGMDGSWNVPATWLSGISPVAASKVTVRNVLNLDSDIPVQIDTLLVRSGANLVLKDNGILSINKILIDSGTISATGNGRININDGGMITNHSTTFNMNGFGTVNFLGSGTINGTRGITVHNLWINSGILTLPVTSASTLKTSLVPWVMGEFRINGGGILAVNGSVTSTYGPRYGTAASLVYASGTTLRRGREWYAPPVDSNAAYPRNIIVENGTSLIFDGGPTVSSPNIVCGGNFTIRSGTVRVDYAKPFEILGNLQIGENAASNAVMNIGRLTTEVDAITPTALTNNASNYLIVRGNFTIYPNSSYNTRLNTRQFHFSGTGSASFEVPGADPLATTPALTLNYVHVEKNGIVTLKSSLAIANSIQFSTGGIIKTDPNIFIRIDSGAQMTGGGSTSFVAGLMQKVTNASSPPNSTSDFTFHIGKIINGSPVYKPVKIANLKHNGTTIYSAEYKDSSTTVFPRSNSFLDAYLLGIWSTEFWEVNKVSGSGKARVGIPYVSGKPWTTVPQGSSNIGVVRWTGSSWEFTKDEDNFNDTTNTYPEFLPVAYTDTVFTDTINTFSPFTLGWGDQNILSINLLYFTGTLSGNDALLKWKIAQTEDLKHFIVEYSNDGRSFTALGTVQWQENKEFSWRHVNPGAGVHYYRLQMVEKSGAKSYSRVEMLQIGVNRTIIAGLVQNPITGGTAILDIYSALAQTAESAVFDMSGRLVFRQQLVLSQGKNNPRLSLLPLAAGQYRMLVRTRDGVEKQLPVTRL